MPETIGGPRRLPGSRTPLVGRGPQRAALAGHLAAVCVGRPAVVLVSGAPGIGKTCLLDELASPEFAQEATVLRGNASLAEGMPPYLPFLEALGEYIASAPAELLREQLGSRAAILATLLPEIVERLGPPEPMPPLPPEQERYRLYEAVAMFLAAIAAPRPLLLLLDDLQWADAATCDLLTYVAGRAHAALLVVCACRDDEAEENPGLTRALAELNRRRLLATVPLRPLDATQTRALAVDCLGGEVAPAAADLLHRQSEGNPFFLEELIRALAEDGTLVQREGHWDLSGRPDRVLPPRVVEAIRMRLTRLSPAVVDLLRVAAVVGRSSDPGLLSQVCRTEVEEVEGLLLAAARAHLVRVDAGGAYTFTHDMVRETLYADVGRERRRRLHGAIGEALAAKGSAGAPQGKAELAFHFTEAGDRDRGVTYALAAGEEALRASAAVEAMGNFRMALRLLGDHDPTRRAQALMGLGQGAMLAGDYPRAAESYEAARGLLVQAGDGVGAARACRELGRARWRQEAGTAAGDAFERALVLLEQEDRLDAAEVLLLLADLLVTSLGQYARGVAHAERALAIVERLGDRRLEARALCVVGNIRARSNDPAAGRTALERSLALAQQLDDPGLAAEACAYLANLSAWTGDVARSRELSLRRLALAERAHDPFELRHVYSWIGTMDTLQGRWPEAEGWFAQQERALEGLQTPEPHATLRAGQGYLHYYRGRFEAAERMYREAVATLRPVAPGGLVWYLGRLGLVLVELRPREEALACFAELQALADPLDRQSSARLCAFAHLAVGYARLQERERAARCYESLLPFRGQFAPIPVDRALGLAAAAGGDPVLARRHLEDAEAQARAAGMRPELALILLERGKLTGDRPAAGTTRPGAGRQPAADPIAAGLQVCEELGMQELGKRTLGALAVRQPARMDGLTERELQVLRLVAEGRSNREIAGILFLSEHTVARHLTHIFIKTGVENRAGAVAYALRHRIV